MGPVDNHYATQTQVYGGSIERRPNGQWDEVPVCMNVSEISSNFNRSSW